MNNDTPIPYQVTAKGHDFLSRAPVAVPGTGIQYGDRWVALVPAAYELQCSCGHQRLNVQLSDFPRLYRRDDTTTPTGSHLWDCPSCSCQIEFDGNDIHVAG